MLFAQENAQTCFLPRLDHGPHCGSLQRSRRSPSLIKGPVSKGGGVGGEEREDGKIVSVMEIHKI